MKRVCGAALVGAGFVSVFLAAGVPPMQILVGVALTAVIMLGVWLLVS